MFLLLLPIVVRTVVVGVNTITIFYIVVGDDWDVVGTTTTSAFTRFLRYISRRFLSFALSAFLVAGGVRMITVLCVVVGVYWVVVGTTTTSAFTRFLRYIS